MASNVTRDHHTWTRDTIKNVSGDVTLDLAGDLTVDVAGIDIHFAVGGIAYLSWAATGILTLKAAADTSDSFSINIANNGVATLSTVDDSGTAGHIKLQPNGDVVLDPDSQKVIIPATDKLYLDGGTDTYIHEVSDDKIQFIVGDDGDIMLQLEEKGDDGNEISFGSSCAGFRRLEASFSTTGAFAFGDLGGTHDTDIDFRFSNKYRLELSNDITNMNLIFPSVSGNFTLVCAIIGSGGGDHDVTNWKVYKANESAATTTDVMWAGGSVPAFTNNGTDIVSFYWDGSESQCYGVASLAFATP